MKNIFADFHRQNLASVARPRGCAGVNRPNVFSCGWLTSMLLLGVISAPAQVQMSLLNYSQNFNTLATSGTPAWADNSTLPGWYAQQQNAGVPSVPATYRADTGTATTGALYSYGSAGAAERALGSLASGTSGALAYGVRFTNNTPSLMTNITVIYAGEQWRNGGNASLAQQSLRFTYRVSATPITSPDVLTNQTWTSVSQLDFISPTTNAAAAALDGNNSTNRVFRSAILTGVSVLPGSEIFFRWVDINDTGNDHGLAIDDLQVTFQAQPLSAVGAEYFFPQTILPPTNGGYIPSPFTNLFYPGGIIISNVIHRRFTGGSLPPALGVTQVHNFNSEVDFDVSTDNGVSFHPASANASVAVQVTHTLDSGGRSFFDTEMLSLNLTTSVGSGTLMLRESPTLASTGKTSTRSVSGGYMISSFFDIFTELSLDGGTTWVPAVSPHHVALRKDPKQTPAVPEPSRLLPPPNGAYVSPAQWHALFAQGIVIKDVSHKFFTGSLQPPAAGGTNTHSINSTLDMQVSTDGGNTFQSVRATAPVQISVVNPGPGNSGHYDTEMTGLSFTLPSGVMIRESPTEPSRGATEITGDPDFDLSISSFFDIFTELSLDGGATWSAATNGPVRMELKQPAIEVPKSSSNLPPLDGSYVSPAQWHALYANGIIITNASHDRFTQTQPPPLPGGNQIENFGSTVGGQISLNGGASFSPFSASANVAVLVNSRADLDNGNARYFETEMLSLNLAGGTLPGGVMVRESPSKASLGRTSVRSVPADGSYRINSFFDIFTEVSLDGGLTWSPSVTAPGTMGLNTNTPAPTLGISCPANITVAASSAAGAVVFYTVTTSGGCPPVNVTANPPSGSTFPVGTTAVTAFASDGCGNSANCSFTVTVTQPAQTPQHFNPSNFLPPTNAVYISPALWHALFANGIVIRDIRHRYFTQNFSPPPLGIKQTHSFGSEVDFEISTDNGATFQPATANATVTVSATHTQDTTAGSSFDTEMLQLDIAGGSLPAGLMLRESPTLQSTGQTTVRQVPGGYMIGSFFDIFTELSVDNGLTWSPAQQVTHVEMRNDPRKVPSATTPSQLLPPPNGSYVSPAQWHALYAQGIVIKDVSHKFFTDSLPPPAGGTNTHTFNSSLDLKLSLDGGNTFQSVRVSAPVQVTVASVGSGNSGMFDTEMTSLSLSIPGTAVMIRESPTEPSRGATQMDAQPDGTYRISSFFDIFTELSLDGGASWSAATNGPVRVQLTPQANEQPAPSPNLPVTNAPYVSPQQWHALYANGIIITNVTHDRFTQTQPPPPPGGSQIENFGSTVSGQVSLNGGATFTPFSVPATSSVQVNSRAAQDTSSTRFFDTEMLSLNLSGGTLPPGLMVRESPSKASLGRTSVRTTADGYRISSFFDIFTEVSLDGGNTWSPSITAPATMSPRLPLKKRYFPNPNLPPTNGQYISPKQWHALYANGIIISNVTHKRFLANLPPPPPRSTNTHNFGSTVNLLIKLPGQQQFTPVTANADCLVSVGSSGFQSSEQVFQTEMLSLNLSGGTLPAGVMIRESPTRQSTGETRYTPATGGYRVSSFFDIFTEISLDGGLTWSVSTTPGYMELHVDPGVPTVKIAGPQLQNGQGAVTFPSQVGLLYLLQYKTNLEDPTWTTLSINPGTGQQMTLSDIPTPPGTKRFYRVEIQEDDNY